MHQIREDCLLTSSPVSFYDSPESSDWRISKPEGSAARLASEPALLIKARFLHEARRHVDGARSRNGIALLPCPRRARENGDIVLGVARAEFLPASARREAQKS
jgi:hypothetical protein